MRRFLLQEAYCNQLTGELGLPKAKPADIRWWTDYHLNWLVKALQVFEDEPAVGIRYINPGIKLNQEDLDLLVGIERPERHLIGIEAKTGHFNSRDRAQVVSKLTRLDPLYKKFAAVGIGFHLCS